MVMATHLSQIISENYRAIENDVDVHRSLDISDMETITFVYKC